MRTPRERAQSFIESSISLPLNHLREHLSELPPNRPIVVHCAGGYRSAIAASLLECSGLTNVADLLGGIAAWDKLSLPLQPQ